MNIWNPISYQKAFIFFFKTTVSKNLCEWVLYISRNKYIVNFAFWQVSSHAISHLTKCAEFMKAGKSILLLSQAEEVRACFLRDPIHASTLKIALRALWTHTNLLFPKRTAPLWPYP